VSVTSPCFHIRWQQLAGNLAGPTFGNQVKIFIGRLEEEEACFPPKGISCFAHRYLPSVETKLACDMSTTIDRPEDASAAVAPLYSDEPPQYFSFFSRKKDEAAPTSRFSFKWSIV
jgi:hypothetical protein